MPSWGELLDELQPHKNENGEETPGLTVDELREKYIKLLSQQTGRNVIAYYSSWLKPGKTQNIDINDSDITGVMNSIKGLDCSKGLDLILHTPGGNPTATEGIVKYLHSKFNNVRVIIPQMAMSAGTMLACSASEIVMGKHSCLGPIDPQYGGIPAYNIITEFREAKTDLDNNAASKSYWDMQLKKYPAAFFYTVLDSIRLSSVLATEWLTNYMFADEENGTAKKKKIAKIVAKLNANNKSHSRHFTFDFCKDLGLKVTALEDDQNLQEAVLSVHHSFIITMDATAATKLIENQNGSRYITSQK